jgi:hypothetical protein
MLSLLKKVINIYGSIFPYHPLNSIHNLNYFSNTSQLSNYVNVRHWFGLINEYLV